MVKEMFCILLMSNQYPGCDVCYLLLGKTGQRAYGILYYFSQLQVNLQLPQKKKEKNKQQEENAYCYHKKTEVEGEKKVCALAN